MTNMTETPRDYIDDNGTFLVDALAMSELYPDTFEYPHDDIPSITEGTNVKICLNNLERLWILVTDIYVDEDEDVWITGMINNYPLFTDEHGYEVEDEIVIGLNNIYAVGEF